MTMRTERRTNMDNSDCMLSTWDNAFNPFEDFVRWHKEDLRLRHDCCGLLARTANVSDFAPPDEVEADIQRAMDEIINEQPAIYRRVFPSDFARSMAG